VIEAAQAVVDSPELHPHAPPKGKRS
jgi:hypothetical protein